MENKDYLWTDNPAVSGVAICDTDILNDCLMHLKYNNSNGLPMFFMLTSDRALLGDEAVGWALQGSFVTMTYPDAVNMIFSEYESGVSLTYRGISCKYSVSGRYIADVSKKEDVDALFAQTGVSEFYVVDTENQGFYLPKTKWFMQYTSDLSLLNTYTEPGLPNHKHAPIYLTGSNADLGDPGQCYMTNNDQINGVQTSANSSTGEVSNNSLYGKSSTVQPPSSYKFLYYKVGDVVTGAAAALIDAKEFLADSVNDIKTEAQKALSGISNASGFLNKNQLTNCILEAPYGVATYSGTTITVKHGLKVLVPNGRNVDGTLNNIEYTVPQDLTIDVSVDDKWSGYLILYPPQNFGEVCVDTFPLDVRRYYQDEQPEITNTATAYWYSPSENIVRYYLNNSWRRTDFCFLGEYTYTSNSITSLTTYHPIDLLKRSDKPDITGWGFPSRTKIILSTASSGSTYITPTNGFWGIKCEGTNSGRSVVDIYNLQSGLYSRCIGNMQGEYLGVIQPASTGDKVGIDYDNMPPENLEIFFVPAVGEKE